MFMGTISSMIFAQFKRECAMTSKMTYVKQTSKNWLWLIIIPLFVSLLSIGSAYAAKRVVVGAPIVFPPNPLKAAAPVPPQFDITGFIQEATLDTNGSICKANDPIFEGGSVKVNGITVIIPCNTILQMPASTLTWQELFTLAPRDIGLPETNGTPTQTGMAINDTVTMPLATAVNGALPSYEIHVQGNVVDGKYIAGLVFISQQSLNLSQGVITAIDYDKAELQVTLTGPTPQTARVRINDPIGRYGKSHGPIDGVGQVGGTAQVQEPYYDQRFSIDEESPTIHSTTSYPMCIPRSGAGDDPECPETNRPRGPDCLSLPSPFPAFTMPAVGDYCMSYMMPKVGTQAKCDVDGNCIAAPDPTKQTPFEVGDNISFLGTLKYDENGAYISAHTIVGNVGIYTAPGEQPAYVGIEVIVQGTAAQPLPNLPQEATSRIKVEGFSTDPTRLVDIFAVDVDPQSGNESERWIGTANPSGPPVIGRFRFKPNAGAFIPATREVRIVSRTMCGDQLNICTFAGQNQLFANGIMAGQFHAPNFEFVFAENLILGDAVVSANLQDLPFLYCGSGHLDGNGPLVRQLDPAPWAAPMPTPAYAATLCPGEPTVGAVAVSNPDLPPKITLFPSASLTVNAGASVFLSASATDASGLPISINWTQSSTGTSNLVPVGAIETQAGQPNAITFTAPYSQGQMIFTATATNPTTGKSSNADVTVNVNAAIADSLSDVKATWVNARQNRGKLTVVAVSNAPLDANGMPPSGLQLFVQASAGTFGLVPDPSNPLSMILSTSGVQLSATPLPMFFADTGSPPVCPTGVQRCWQFVTQGALVDPANAGLFIPPDEVTVTSSFGGTAKATQNNGNILIR
jgi:hypothetical protein